MIPPGYPQLPVRAKVGLAPVVAIVFAVYTLGHHGVIDFRLDAGAGPGPPATHHHKATPPPAPSKPALADIPGNYLALYRSAAPTCSRLSWTVLAGIGKKETNHGRGWAPRWADTPGIKRGTENSAGAGGPMQFLSGTWAVYGQGGDRYDPRDAIPAAARLLCRNGIGANPPPPDVCPGVLGTARQHAAIFAYNHACWYVDQVLTLARSYQAGGR